MFSFLRKSDPLTEALACHQRGVELLNSGGIKQSLSEFEKATRLDPRNAKYFNSLGNAQKAIGNQTAAESSYRMAIEIDPSYIAALYNLALLLREGARLQEAERLFRRIHDLDPNDSDVLFHIGHMLASRSEFGEAVSMYERAISLSPGNPHVWLYLGYAYHAMPERTADAIRCLKECVALQPDLADAHVRLGLIYKELSRLELAEQSYRVATRLDPRQAQLHFSLANTLNAMGKWTDAISSLKETIRLDPTLAIAYSNIGTAMVNSGQLRQAIDYYKRAIAVQPTAIDPHFNLGATYSALREYALAKESFEAALRIEPDNVSIKNILLHDLQQTCDWSHFNERVAACRASITTHPNQVSSPFSLLSIPSTAAEQLQFSRNHVQYEFGAVINSRQQLNFSFDRAARGRLRVGYLSNDFRRHALAHLLSELIELHDRKKFEITAYSFGIDDDSSERKRFVSAFDTFTDIRTLSHVDAAKKIFADKVDILVDLMAHTQGARTEILALRPAPIQVNYLGYPGTMGAEFMDYIISDRVITPSGHEDFYAEKLVTLPGSYQVNDRKRPIGPLVTRLDVALPDSAFVFCCFNRNYKILPGVFSAWMQILKKVPSGILWLVESNRWAAENLRIEATHQGIDANRLVFAPVIPIEQHLSRLRVADLFLDTSPYGAHTTASDALWMGLPVVTCMGETFASRVAASLLHAAGIPELVTDNLDDYVELSTRLAQNPIELIGIKDKLARNRGTAPLFDTPAYARNIEAAYTKMQENFLSGTGSQPIHL